MGRKIFFFFSFLLLSVASLYCFSFVCGYALTFDNTQNNISDLSEINKEVLSSSSNNTKTESNILSSQAVSSENTISTAAKGNAKGKIVYRTIDSSGANLKYQKVYIRNSAGVSVDLKTELLNLPKLRIKNTSSPQVLIVHTHTTESFMEKRQEYYTDTDKTRTTDDAKNLVAVGAVLKTTLEKQGIAVVHATEKHDYPEYSGSYSRSKETINKYLEKYPTIKVVIDLHRDSVTDNSGNKSAFIATVKGKEAAQVMIVSGCQGEGVTDFPNWRENLKLAVRLQQTMEVMYPSLARPILLTARKYNQNITTGSLLIECGTEANTLEQAKYSAELLGNSIVATLNTLKE